MQERDWGGPRPSDLVGAESQALRLVRDGTEGGPSRASIFIRGGAWSAAGAMKVIEIW